MKQNTWIKIQIVSTSFKTSLIHIAFFCFGIWWEVVSAEFTIVCNLFFFIIFLRLEFLDLFGVCVREKRIEWLFSYNMLHDFLLFSFFPPHLLFEVLFYIIFFNFLNGVEIKVLSRKLRKCYIFINLVKSNRKRLLKRTVVKNKFW